VLERNGTRYLLKHRDTGKEWERCVANVDRWHGTIDEDKDHVRAEILQDTGHEPDAISEGDLIATCDEPPDVYYLGRVLQIRNDKVTVHFCTADRADPAKALFRLTWITPDNMKLRATCKGKKPNRSGSATPWTGVYDLDSAHILRTGCKKLQLFSNGRLKTDSVLALAKLGLPPAVG